jgi:dihydroneopterin aldolase
MASVEWFRSGNVRRANQPSGDSMDTVFISDLRVDAVIGIFDWERRIRQTLSVDIEVAADCAAAAATDDVAQAVDYKDLAKRVVAFLQESQFQLVETAAERTAEMLRAEVGVPWVRLRLHKPGALREARDVGVVIERGEWPRG